MKFLGRIIELLDTEMETPQMYGWFHLTFFALLIIGCVVLCYYKKQSEERFVRQLLIFSALIVLILEIYKQVNFTFSFDGTKINADYQWYIFPFQFCSMPMYISLLAGIVRKGKLHDSLCAFLATFAVFAGLCVMFYPAQIFIKTIGINIQSLICHSMMILVGVYLMKSGYVCVEHKTILKAIPVFISCVLIAIIMNEIAFLSGILESETFNMFFISPHCEPHLPVYSSVQAVVPFPWCLIIYVIGFSLAAYIVLLIAVLIKHLWIRYQSISTSSFDALTEKTSYNNTDIMDREKISTLERNRNSK